MTRETKQCVVAWVLMAVGMSAAAAPGGGTASDVRVKQIVGLHAQGRALEAERYRESMEMFIAAGQSIEGRAALAGLASIQLEEGDFGNAAKTYKLASGAEPAATRRRLGRHCSFSPQPE